MTDHLKKSAACIMVTRLVTELFQTGTEEVSVFNHLAPLKRFCDYGAGYN